MKQKRAYFFIFAGLMFLFFGMKFLALETTTAEIEVLAFSPNDVDPDREGSDPTKKISAGIPTIGVQDSIFLSGNDGAVSYAWTLAEKPDGSTAEIENATSQVAVLRPDVVGQYKVTLVVDGTSEPDELWITAATYVGVGTVGGLTPDYTKGQCGVCHSDKEAQWSQTNHATAMQLKLDGATGFYLSSCNQCHTVGYNVNADNGGFDDIARDQGWEFPSTLQVGNFDSLVVNFPDLAAVSNIQCENCHGPGSQHKGLTDKNQISKSFETGVCNQCHDADPYHVFSEQWRTSKHAVATQYPSGPDRGSCVECHTGSGFITTYDADYTEVNTDYNSINCQTCHDPHSKENEHQLRRLAEVELGNGEIASGGGNGQVCMNCHKSRRNAEEYVVEYHSHYGPHHGPQTDMLLGTNAIEYGLPVGISPHADVVENTCAGCHMQDFDPHGSNHGLDQVKEDFNDPAMSDELATTLSRNAYSHSFWNSYTDSSGTEYDNVAACRSCHGDIQSFDDILANEDFDQDGTIEGVQSEVEGMMTALAILLPPLGEDEVTVTADYTPNQLKAAYNYLFVMEDGSKGVHNSAYATGLLRASINALEAGDIGAGSILSVTDVPNDQGKQVRITWSRFPGDGDTDIRIVRYGIWREVEAAASKEASENTISIADYDEMFAQLPNAEGKLFKVGGDEVWDFVKEVPAAGLTTYSTIVPTIYDSTITDGQHLTRFQVSGHATNNTVVMSAATSGYSVDNLAPEAPQSLAFSNAALSWQQSEDADFKFFSIYRGTSAGFTPGESNRVGVTTANAFVDNTVGENGTYFYKVSSVDFSGNESSFSNEAVAAFAVAVEENVLTTVSIPADNATVTVNFANDAAVSLSFTSGNVADQAVLVKQVSSIVADFPTVPDFNSEVYYYDISLDVADFEADLTFGYDEATVNGLGIPEDSLRVSYFDDGGNIWRVLPGVLNKDNNTVTVTANHFSLWAVTGSEALITDVEADDAVIPVGFELLQNYPNPFNPTTVIQYRLPVASEVTLKIYNLLGQEVRSLVNSFEPAGNLRVTWDGRDNTGQAVSPGVYLYRLVAGNYVSVKKMVLVK